MKILREIGVFGVTEQRLVDQSRVIRRNGWLPEAELDEILRKIKNEENMEEPRIELENTCDWQRSQKKTKYDEINRVLNYFVTENILPTNRLLKAAGCAVAKKK